MRIRPGTLLLLLAFPALVAAPGRAQLKDPPLQIPGITAPKQNAAPQVEFLGPAEAAVAAGREQTVELRFRIAPGLHINSHTPREKYLIPTRLTVAESNGLAVRAADFPPGQDFQFSFAPKEKLSVYSGAFTILAHLSASRGQHLMEGKLRFQACDLNACMPPRTIPVAVRILAR